MHAIATFLAPDASVIGALLVLAAVAPLTLDGQVPDGAETAWNQASERWRGALAAEGMVGASLGLVTDAGLVRLETFGKAELPVDGGGDVPVDDATIYHWASITKTFTAVSIMQLRDRGLLSLDDPIVDYVPELRDVHNPFGSMEAITIRQVMSHSAGFRGGTWPWGGDQDWHPWEPTEWSQLVAMMPYTRIHFAPGSRFSYSNPGIIFLGRVIERVTGDVFEAYVDKNIFRPLGMRRAYFDATPWHLLPHRANHYWIGPDGPRAGGRDFNTGITVSNGGLNAPVGDMARYLAFLMGGAPDARRTGETGGTGDAAGGPAPDGRADAVLARSSLEEMWRAVVPIGDSPLGPERMGLSFFLYDHPGGSLVGHTGTQRAYYSFVLFDPEAGVGVVGAFNAVGEDGRGPDTAALRERTRADVADTVFPFFQAGR